MRNWLAESGTWGQNKRYENKNVGCRSYGWVHPRIPSPCGTADYSYRVCVLNLTIKRISNKSQTKSKIISLEWSIRSVDIIDSRISHYCTLVLIITYFHVYSIYKYVEYAVGLRSRYSVLASPSADELRLTPNRSHFVRVQSMYVRRTDNLSGLLPVSYSMVN